MDNKELTQLIDSFKGYRDLLAPISRNLSEFVGTYDAMRQNIESLNSSFEGDFKSKVEELFKQMTAQSAKANDLSSHVEKLASTTDRYTQSVGGFLAKLEKIENRLSAITTLEQKAEGQIGRLDALLTEKSKSYNLNQLTQSLDKYNDEIKKVAGFINKDVGGIIEESHAGLMSMKGGIDELVKKRSDEQETIRTLIESYKATESYLKTITESRDVNEAYMYEVLDKWAASRGVKTK